VFSVNINNPSSTLVINLHYLIWLEVVVSGIAAVMPLRFRTSSQMTSIRETPLLD
jgi:hypothetical protein